MTLSCAVFGVAGQKRDVKALGEAVAALLGAFSSSFAGQNLGVRRLAQQCLHPALASGGFKLLWICFVSSFVKAELGWGQ